MFGKPVIVRKRDAVDWIIDGMMIMSALAMVVIVVIAQIQSH